MKNIDSYIASGILEDYLAGTLTDAEKQEVETQLALYPSLRQELDELSKTLEGFALDGAVAPPDFVKANILSQLDFAGEQTTPPAKEPASKIVPLAPRRKLWWAVAAAAVLLPLAGVFYMQLEQNRQNELDRLAEEQFLATREAEIVKPSVEQSYVVSLKSEDALSTTSALLIWKPSAGEVMLNVQLLPPIAKGKHYQLWAVFKNRYSSLGVVSASAGQQVMGKTQTAEAFVITLESSSKSTTPSLSNTVIKGEVN